MDGCRALCGPQGTDGHTNALCRPAAMAGEAHLAPFRTQKLSPRAPMVLRSESVGEQDVADQLGAFSRLAAELCGSRGGRDSGPRRAPPRV